MGRLKCFGGEGAPSSLIPAAALVLGAGGVPISPTACEGSYRQTCPIGGWFLGRVRF